MNGYPQMLRTHEIVVTRGMESRRCTRVANLCHRCVAGKHKPRPCLNVVADAPADHVCKCTLCGPPAKEGAA